MFSARELAAHLVGGDAPSEHPRGIELDADFAIDAAHALDLADARAPQAKRDCRSLSMNQERSWGDMPSPSTA